MTEKQVLKTMARRYAKGVLESAEDGIINFLDAGLTQEQVNCILAEYSKIINRTTEKLGAISIDALVDQYFEK